MPAKKTGESKRRRAKTSLQNFFGVPSEAARKKGEKVPADPDFFCVPPPLASLISKYPPRVRVQLPAAYVFCATLLDVFSCPFSSLVFLLPAKAGRRKGREEEEGDLSYQIIVSLG